MSLNFRSANHSDVDELVRLVNKAYRPELGEYGWTHESELVSGSRTNTPQLLEILERPNSVILVALKESKIIGCVHIEKSAAISYIGMLAVNPTTQGAGIGKQLLSCAENYVNKKFHSEKFRMVVVSSRAELMAFYLRCGYLKTGEVMDYPMSSGTGIPKKLGLKVEILEKANC